MRKKRIKALAQVCRQVSCEVIREDLEGDFYGGRLIPLLGQVGWFPQPRVVEVPGVRVICSRCGHETESYGEEDVSVSRCLVLLREECPNGESNYYVDDCERRMYV